MKKWKRLKIKTKIMLLYAALATALLAILIPVVFYITVSSFRDSLESLVEESVENVSMLIYEKDGVICVDEDIDAPELIYSGVYIRVESEGEIIYESPDASWAFETYEEGFFSSDRIRSWVYLDASVYVENIDEPVYIYALGSVYYSGFIEELAIILVCLGAIFLLISILGSRFIVSRALWPVKRITQTAAAVSVNDPSKRIEGIESKDEVGELAKTFNLMLDDIETSFKRERQFTSDVSHELRTPITVIETCADDALRTENQEIIRENLEIIKKENGRMAKMISQLLFLSRGYEGRLNFEPENFALFELVDSVSEVLYADAQKKNISIHNEIPEDLDVYADQSMFVQLFVNLMENAVKYGKEGGNIWIEAFKRQDITRIIAKDDGCGISDKDLPHIFERFYRADRARDRSGQGLGLSIVKQIVDFHGGDIFAVSKEDEGTTFCMEIKNSKKHL